MFCFEATKSFIGFNEQNLHCYAKQAQIRSIVKTGILVGSMTNYLLFGCEFDCIILACKINQSTH